MSPEADPAQACSSSIDLTQLPLILAGPILRRTTAEAVTVWLALQRPCDVELTIRTTHEAGKAIGPVVLRGKASTIRLGHSLHIVAVTAATVAVSSNLDVSQTSSAQPGAAREATKQQRYRLEPGQLYAYDLEFHRSNPGSDGNSPSPPAISLGQDSSPVNAIPLQQALISAAFPDLSISYFSHGLPTFALCPTQLDQLQLFHGSCRNVQDRGRDALAIVDCAAAHHAAQPNQRPHQLIFTGDQIYGDEVADPFLWAILQVKAALWDWVEPLDITEAESLDWHQALQPGQRSQIATDTAGLTASLENTPEKASSHLFRFGEYCIAYLFSWSQCFWQLDFPPASALGYRGKQAQRWDQDVVHLNRNRESQPLVRRALANVPTYMIFDDHDVSDDWNLNRAWCQRVLGSTLGYQVVRNAMLAYALFQAWGNTPEQFAAGTVGGKLLNATEAWCGRGDRATAATLARLLGLPPKMSFFAPMGRPGF